MSSEAEALMLLRRVADEMVALRKEMEQLRGVLQGIREATPARGEIADADLIAGAIRAVVRGVSQSRQVR